MADAGKIMIFPKGNYSATSVYEVLDLVNHNGVSWVAKKNGINGIEPSEANSEYWFKLVGTAVANNLTTTAEGYVLDARQGNTLLNEITGIKEEIAVERARISALASLSEGSTTGDAELIDARIGADGTTYASAGESVRTQVNAIRKNLDNHDFILLRDTMDQFFKDKYSVFHWQMKGLGIILDMNGRYYFVNADEFSLASDELLVLSTKSDSIDTPFFDGKTIASGTTLYLIKVTQRAFKKDYKVIIYNSGGKLYSYNNFLNDLMYSENDFVLQVNPYDVITYNGNNLVWNMKGQCTVFDMYGKYYLIDATDITLGQDEILVLSTVSDAVVTPKLGDISLADGRKLFLVKVSNRLFRPNYMVVAFSRTGMLYSHHNFLNNFINNTSKTLEQKGLLPSESFERTSLDGTLSIFKKMREKKGDVTIVHVGDSITTNGNYTSSLEDSAYRPPRMDEKYLPFYIEELLRWRGQEYRRSDAMTEKDGNTPMFTEVSTSAEDKYYDSAWDWQVDGNTITDISQNYYRLFTRVLSGDNCSVTFTLPAGTKNASFIYRTDYLCADKCSVSVSNGNSVVRARLFESDTLVEANGFEFSMKETDEVLSYTSKDYTGAEKVRTYRRSRGQKRLVFHVDNPARDITITISNVGTGRLNYWGVEYTPYDAMIRYINVSRGGHNLSALSNFESYDIDEFKPDLILLQCPIINEGAISLNAPVINTTSAFAERFRNYVANLKAKDYLPEVIPYVLYVGIQANIVDADGNYCRCLTDEGYVDTYKYIGALDDALTEENGFILNYFYNFDEIAHKLADYGSGNMFTDAIKGSGKTGGTFTCDDVHLNDYGSLVAYRLMKKELSK